VFVYGDSQWVAVGLPMGALNLLSLAIDFGFGIKIADWLWLSSIISKNWNSDLWVGELESKDSFNLRAGIFMEAWWSIVCGMLVYWSKVE
jgi:hypothetical protein